MLPVLASSSAQAGTPHYMAPEVARGLPIAKPTASDPFGVGVVIHDLAHLGVGAASAEDAASAGSATLPERVLYARAASGFAVRLDAHVPQPLATLLLACLAVDPEVRPTSGAIRQQLLLLAPESSTWTWT